MKVSVSTAFFGRINPELVHLYSEARIDAMETAAPNAFSLEKYDFKGVADECRACGVEWRSAHLPFGSEVALAHLDKKIRESSLEIEGSGFARGSRCRQICNTSLDRAE